MAQISLTSSDLRAVLSHFAPGITAVLSDTTLTVGNKTSGWSVALKTLSLNDHITVNAAGLNFQIASLSVKNDSLELAAKISE